MTLSYWLLLLSLRNQANRSTIDTRRRNCKVLLHYLRHAALMREVVISDSYHIVVGVKVGHALHDAVICPRLIIHCCSIRIVS